MSKKACKSHIDQGSKNKKTITQSNSNKYDKNKHNIFNFKTYIKKTDIIVILDLDNTLISALFFPIHPEQCDFLFTLQNGKIKSKIGVIKRPYVDQFLNSISSFATIYLFTTSEKEYTTQILNHIDPSGKLISKIFTREYCTQNSCKKYEKDYSICGTDMMRTIIVDDLPENFKNLPKNGIVVKPFNSETDDVELPRVFEEIIRRSYFDDVREGACA